MKRQIVPLDTELLSKFEGFASAYVAACAAESQALPSAEDETPSTLATRALIAGQILVFSTIGALIRRLKTSKKVGLELDEEDLMLMFSQEYQFELENLSGYLGPTEALQDS